MATRTYPISTITYVDQTLSGSSLITTNELKASAVIAEYPVSGGNVCRHIRALNTVNGYYRDLNLDQPVGSALRYPVSYRNYIPWSCESNFRESWEHPGLTDLINRHTSSLNKVEDDTSGFELLNFFGELDETLAMFSKKFLRELSYGSITWGVLPFINDVKALLITYRNLFSSRGPSCSSVARRRPIAWTVDESQVPYGAQWLQYSADGNTSVSGVLYYKPPNLLKSIDKGLYLLDQFGVHPDLKTVWDLLPLSFVIDYFLPIGELLESLHPRGWSNSSLIFDGWTSVKYRTQVRVIWRWDGPTQLFAPCVYSVYYRDKGLLPTYFSPEWNCPSFLQLFNTAYVMLSRL